MLDSGIKLIKPKVAYGIIQSGKSSKHCFILSWRDEDWNRQQEFHSLVDLQYLLINATSSVHRREETSQSEVWPNGARNTMLRGSMWLETIGKERLTKLKLTMRWHWRRRPPDGRRWSSEEMDGHPFKHRRRKRFEKC